MRLIIWRVLDLYSHKFNENWGFPTSCCVPSTSPQQKHVVYFCHAIDSSPKQIDFFQKLVDNHHSPTKQLIFVLVFSLIFLAFLWTLDMFDFLPVCLISLVVFILIGLILSCGRVNLPYILARLKIIEPNDIHHGVTHYRYLSHIAWPEQFTHSLFSPLSRHRPGCVDISCVLFHSGSHRIVPPSPSMLSYCGCSVLCI